ncbi:hypothetical protein ABEB36_010250 [Hypothenemus hampei]|uniref:Uncharacterized protein n=1 Tax=Hypothenemus hampei TaxID=57062 RepID=A0ABD1EJG8_HYPHA
MVVSQAHVILLIINGELLKREADKTINICYEKLHKHNRNDDMNRHLLQLTQQVFQRRPRISAAGFFSVDHSLILFICTTTATYIIFLCQFESSKSTNE